MNWETLLCFGDSITFGARSYLGYPEVSGSILEKKLSKQWNVVNHATNGFTTIDLARSMNSKLITYKEIFPSLITIMIGTNDIKNNTSPEDFNIAYRQVILKARLVAINNNILLIKIPRFTNQVFYPYLFDMNKKVNEFNALIEIIANENGIRVLEFSLEDDDFFDGVHFSNQGTFNAGRQLATYILKDKGFENIADLSEIAISTD